jgi:hypothetical protein
MLTGISSHWVWLVQQVQWDMSNGLELRSKSAAKTRLGASSVSVSSAVTELTSCAELHINNTDLFTIRPVISVLLRVHSILNLYISAANVITSAQLCFQNSNQFCWNKFLICLMLCIGATFPSVWSSYHLWTMKDSTVWGLFFLRHPIPFTFFNLAVPHFHSLCNHPVCKLFLNANCDVVCLFYISNIYRHKCRHIGKEKKRYRMNHVHKDRLLLWSHV